MTGPDADGYTVVTGGAGFLGSAVTGRLLADGQRVVVLDRETPARPEAHAFQVDLADEAALERVLGRLLEERGAPGALALCHGWSPKGADGSRIPETDVPADLFRQVIDANLTSCFVLLRTLVPAMAAAGTGRVVAIGSAAAHTGRTTAGSAYAAAKAGVAALVRTFGARYAPQGVLINDVSPGKIANPNWPDSPEAIARYRQEIPMGRLAEAGEVADAIAFLLSHRNTYITGQTVIVDGGRLP
ncbi:SDR family oxidoreductase [Streptomyces violaceus]|uniref:SDR family NAD(P)-dependent oxidoreductase n=1 Tax=Streptomyces violaceus TaxID=1936 RepID=UPI002E2A0E25|nr:SDR family oxidoreductase [Streptomyces violaceus]